MAPCAVFTISGNSGNCRLDRPSELTERNHLLSANRHSAASPGASGTLPAAMTETTNRHTLSEGQFIPFSYHNPRANDAGLIGKLPGVGGTGLLSALGSLGCIAVGLPEGLRDRG